MSENAWSNHSSIESFENYRGKFIEIALRHECSPVRAASEISDIQISSKCLILSSDFYILIYFLGKI